MLLSVSLLFVDKIGKEYRHAYHYSNQYGQRHQQFLVNLFPDASFAHPVPEYRSTVFVLLFIFLNFYKLFYFTNNIAALITAMMVVMVVVTMMVVMVMMMAVIRTRKKIKYSHG